MTTRRIGLILAVAISSAALIPAIDIRPDAQTGRIGPLSVIALLVTSVIAILTVTLVVPAWRGGRRAGITIALAQLAGIVTSLPAFFAPAELVPPGAIVAAAVGALVQVAVFAMIVVEVSTLLLHTAAAIAIVAVYALGVSLTTALVPPSADRLVQTAVAIAVALLFQPVLSLLRRSVGRALYGVRRDPVAASLQVGQHAGGQVDAAAAAEDAARVLRLPRIEVRDGERIVAASASPVVPGATVVQIPLGPEGAPTFHVTLRPGERRLHRDDRAALDLIAVPVQLLIREAELLTQLRVARAATADARGHEQRSLHRELHDGIGPLLTGAVMHADAARNLVLTDTDSACEQLDVARADLRMAVAELRRVVHGLWPLELEQRGLWDAIALRAARSGARLDLPPDRPSLSPSIELACYRIISESLTNVDRHAPGATTSLTVRVSREQLHLLVDNHGAPQDGVVEGVGLTSIRARVEELGGRTRIGPCRGRWIVEAVIPLRRGRSPDAHRTLEPTPRSMSRLNLLSEPEKSC